MGNLPSLTIASSKKNITEFMKQFAPLRSSPLAPLRCSVFGTLIGIAKDIIVTRRRSARSV